MSKQYNPKGLFLEYMCMCCMEELKFTKSEFSDECVYVDETAEPIEDFEIGIKMEDGSFVAQYNYKGDCETTKFDLESIRLEEVEGKYFGYIEFSDETYRVLFDKEELKKMISSYNLQLQNISF